MVNQESFHNPLVISVLELVYVWTLLDGGRRRIPCVNSSYDERVLRNVQIVQKLLTTIPADQGLLQEFQEFHAVSGSFRKFLDNFGQFQEVSGRLREIQGLLKDFQGVSIDFRQFRGESGTLEGVSRNFWEFQGFQGS